VKLKEDADRAEFRLSATSMFITPPTRFSLSNRAHFEPKIVPLPHKLCEIPFNALLPAIFQ